MTKYLVDFCKEVEDEQIEDSEVFDTLKLAFDFIEENIRVFYYCAISEIDDTINNEIEPF